MFKTELHCHSRDASPCSTESAESLVEIYTKAGYDTVVLTNHFSPCVYDVYKCKSMNEYVDIFMDAYKRMKDAAGDRLTVLCGAEIRFNCDANDYLVFGDFEEYFRSDSELFNMTPKTFHELCRQKGWLFIQAHPFRNGITVTNPEYIDGIEVYNGHIGHAERNFIAEQWAKEYGLTETSGTDLHYAYVPASGGIKTDEKIQSIEQLIKTLKNGRYKLLKENDVR
ncbi:MAG: hypothetical protein IKA61_03745 [Clostridia bacterium]|nr:hypothetical protein [Clostridia bacterium]